VGGGGAEASAGPSRFFVQRLRAVARGRRVVDRVDGDRDGGGTGRVDGAIVGLEVEAVGAVVIGRRVVGDLARRVGDAVGQVAGDDVGGARAGAVGGARGG